MTGRARGAGDHRWPGLRTPTARSAVARPTTFLAVFSLVRWLPDGSQPSACPFADLARSDLGAFCCIMRA
jgi:hypothetical protein